MIAVVFTAVGILIAPHIDLTGAPGSVVSGPVLQAGAYPLVERDGEVESPFVQVVEHFSAAVVNVSAQSRGEVTPWWFQGSGSTTSSGSGFFFRNDGYILTNNHVVENAVKLTVTTSSGYTYEAKLVGNDRRTDLAVLKVEPEEPITVIPFGDSDKIKVGNWAIAIGNPFPQQGLDRTVTVGVISALGRSNLHFGRETPDYQSYIQTDASINPGNSGGPLLNIKGECIGINAAISSPTGASVGIGFAIPINLARAIVPDLIATGKAQRGWLGVWFHETTEREAKRQGMDAVMGITADSVFAGSPAQQAGIVAGDVIVGFGDQSVDNAGRLSVLVSTARGGETVPIHIIRDGERLALQAEIVDRDAFLASSSNTGTTQDDFEHSSWMGMELLTYTAEIAKAISNQHVPGVYVRRVAPGSAADFASVTRGTVILQVNDVSVKNLDEMEEVVAGLGRDPKRVPLMVQEPDGALTRKVLRPLQ
ncbi:MAG: trypsin-like peptidase domain-containing protein [bacterium]